MGLFTGTTKYYRQLRRGIPHDVAVVLDHPAPVRPDGRRRLLDVGTGSGLVAEALLSAEDCTPPVGWQAELVTICRAFHIRLG